MNHVLPMKKGGAEQTEEGAFWEYMSRDCFGPDVQPGIAGEKLGKQLRMGRILCMSLYMGTNILWLIILCSFYYYTQDDFEQLNKYGIAIDAFLGMVLLFLTSGMVIHKTRCTFRTYISPHFVRQQERPIWIHPRTW